MLGDLARHGEATIPVPAGDWALTAGSEPGRCLSAMVHCQCDGDQLPIAWLGVAAHSRCGARLWEAMHDLEISGDGGELATDRARPPATPWLATRMLPGAVRVLPPDWLADMSECLAWTWLLEAQDAETPR
jgi:hypothetical protein